ncbi:MAG: hypothetical protein CMP05_13205 [Xanthomarina sp.]|uniref:hypothetical protein n=1 Tax=Xanthomarina sp. TaxID=1931211 RepID=UPI000C5540B3|nr:hypothetical protein [Xanthomarina sp.]MAL23014.1 hypothetical protein [Xanthomarina sp.]MBF62938.1 hypothetical protein [Xanthomarina sp.]HAB26892.1 hypothetical protein [Xanthomarina gelatinilytica]|tara:strand:+ start:369 stop:572 length:204 start_codon:yes stop_codon:yes gene_type:complete
MRKFKVQKISKEDVYVRYLIAAVLILIVLTAQLTGLPCYFLLTLAGVLLLTGIAEKSFLKARFYPDE